MGGILFKPEVSVGDILTVGSILLSLVALLTTLYRDQQLKRKEYADKIRHSAATIIAKLERWRELELRFYQDVQPIMIDTSLEFLKTKDIYATRDYLWRELVRTRTISLQRFSDEQIEIAYVDLYGYNSNVQELFTKAIDQMKRIEEDMNVEALTLTQNEILELDPVQHVYSAEIGNNLRDACERVAKKHKELMDAVLKRFRNEMMKIVGEASDSKIVNKKVKIESAGVLLKPEELQDSISVIASSKPSRRGVTR
jgi:hypothetical protein